MALIGGEYELHIYKYKDSVNNSVEVDIYDSYKDGKNITGETFNLKYNGTNFSVYVQDKDIDYSYNYIAKITLKYDPTNTGTNLTTNTVSYLLKAISNDADVSIGSTTLVQNGTSCEVRFYDSYYNIDSINKITYSIYDLANNSTTTKTFTPEWILVNDTETSTTYYKIILPAEFSTSGVYTIQINLYVDSTLAGQIDSTFIYTQE